MTSQGSARVLSWAAALGVAPTIWVGPRGVALADSLEDLQRRLRGPLGILRVRGRQPEVEQDLISQDAAQAAAERAADLGAQPLPELDELVALLKVHLLLRGGGHRERAAQGRHPAPVSLLLERAGFHGRLWGGRMDLGLPGMGQAVVLCCGHGRHARARGGPAAGVRVAPQASQVARLHLAQQL
jgi:hypothetical protein